MKPIRWRFALLLCAALGSMAFGNNCTGVGPEIDCDSLLPPFVLQSGTCTELVNPCGDHEWERLDNFRLCGESPAGLFISSERNPRARLLCLSSGVALAAGVPVESEYKYITPSGYGIGTLRVIGTGIEVEATAAPIAIPTGASSQLDAIVSGGIPPLSYEWKPALELDDPLSQSPIATPENNTNFTVTVTDSAGFFGMAEVAVYIGVGATAYADPPAIDPGGISSFFAISEGGSPPYSYSWAPTSGLDQADIATPLASPLRTTTYEVVITDSFGVQSIPIPVTLRVNLEVLASAAPEAIDPGDSSQLTASEPLGGLPPFSYRWTPASSLDDPNSPTPIATPSVPTDYTLTVEDAEGALATDTVMVDVVGGVQACFTLTEIATVAADADPSCSVGSIVEYRWWNDYVVGDPPDLVTAQLCPDAPAFCKLFAYETTGDKRIRLEVLSSSGSTHATAMIFNSH
jgi:hypothetical protein